ncbi:MAG: hypothetical protein ACRCZF_05770 [Gemmataceae bacterium]
MRRVSVFALAMACLIGYCADAQAFGRRRAQCAQPCPQPVQVCTQPYLQQTSYRTYAITESGNPAPANGWYVEVYVISTGRTWYYGPYANYQPDGLAAFNALRNPSTQYTALPQYIAAGTMLQPW